MKDVAEAPCVAGEWVYYLPDLDEIDKVKLDGSQKAKVCSTDAFQVYNANLDIYHDINGGTSVTAEYKDGYVYGQTHCRKQCLWLSIATNACWWQRPQSPLVTQ